MKRLFTLFAFAAAVTVGQAQELGEPTVIKGGDNALKYVPAELSYDGKIHIVSESYEAGTNIVTVYDEDMKAIRTIKMAADYGEEYVNLDYNGNFDDSNTELPVTQTLFNTNAEYEWTEPITKMVSYKDSYSGEERTAEVLAGFKIVTESGMVLQEVKAPFEVTYDNEFYLRQIVKANGRYFLLAYVDYRSSSVEEYYLYPVNRNTANGISPVGAPVKVKASPSLARRGQTVTVQLDEDATRERTVTVTNAAGQRVWHGTAKPGQKTVTISTDRLSHGVNIVNVEGESARATCKVIVR